MYLVYTHVVRLYIQWILQLYTCVWDWVRYNTHFVYRVSCVYIYNILHIILYCQSFLPVSQMETLDWSLSWGMRKGTHCSYCVVLLCGVVYVYNHDVVHVQCCCVSSAFHSCPCELSQQWVSFMSHVKTSCCGKLLCHFLHCSPSLVLHCRTHADTQTFDMHYIH